MSQHINSNQTHRLVEIHGGHRASRLERLRSRLVRLLAFLLTAVLVLGAVVLVVNYDKLNFDFIKRWFSYRTLERGDGGQAESFQLDGSGTNTIVDLDGDLLVCSTTGVRLYSASGQIHVDHTVTMEHPAAEAAGSTALAYDAGGRTLIACRDREEVFSLELSQGESILSADVNEKDWMVVLTRVSGTKGIITVYNDQFAQVMQIKLSERFVMDAALSPDNQSVALLTMGLSGGTFASMVELYPTSGDSTEDVEPQVSTQVGSEIILDMCWDEYGIWALGENSVFHLDDAGALTGSYSYAGRYLKGFSLEGEGTAVLLLGKYRAGSTADLVVVSPEGEETAILSLEEQVLSISAAGRYVGVLTADRLDIYNPDLTIYHTLDGTQSARKVLQRSDGSAMLLNNDTARIYLPQ